MAGGSFQGNTGEFYVEEALFLRESGNVIYIRATGHITANSCSELKSRVFGRLEAKPPVDAVYVDLEHCEYMDSTFMGLLVGFNKRFLRFAEKPMLDGVLEEGAQRAREIARATLDRVYDRVGLLPRKSPA